MTITIPDELRAKAEERAKRYGFASLEEYVIELVETDEKIDEYEGEASHSFRTREEFAALIQAGIDSGGAIVVDEAFWEERRRVLREKIAQRGGIES